MSREVRRVSLTFDWPLKQVWQGYLMPDKYEEDPCPGCKSGYSPYAQHLLDTWYGNAPFSPLLAGSEPHLPDAPAIRALAERHIERDSDFYGAGEVAVDREARRLANLFNGAWSHHLSQLDVDALVAAGRLVDFTHSWSKGEGWQKIDPPVTPTAREVNEWSLSGFGHDSINASVVIKARCERDGEDYMCQVCQGHGSIEAYPGQRAEAEKWEPTPPPAGEGWQLWETVSEGSPVTPVLPTADALVTYLCAEQGFNATAARTLVNEGSTLGSFVVAGGTVLHSATDADVVHALGDPDSIFTGEDLAAAEAEYDLGANGA